MLGERAGHHVAGDRGLASPAVGPCEHAFANDVQLIGEAVARLAGGVEVGVHRLGERARFVLGPVATLRRARDGPAGQ
jgi:hypothetical protein